MHSPSPLIMIFSHVFRCKVIGFHFLPNLPCHTPPLSLEYVYPRLSLPYLTCFTFKILTVCVGNPTIEANDNANTDWEASKVYPVGSTVTSTCDTDRFLRSDGSTTHQVACKEDGWEDVPTCHKGKMNVFHSARSVRKRTRT